MKAFILAAGLGTRLRPWTLSHPKALVPVEGLPMLRRVIENLRDKGFDRIVVNVHHFASQIVDYLNENDFGVEIAVSDESASLLETGGGLLHARRLLDSDDTPFLVHNVDILSNADLPALMAAQEGSRALGTLLVNRRDSNRKLLFDEDMTLAGWHSLKDNSYRPDGFLPGKDMREFAFSGIYTLSPDVFPLMDRLGFKGAFPIMDFFMAVAGMRDSCLSLKGLDSGELRVLDIGKPDSLAGAATFLAQM